MSAVSQHSINTMIEGCFTLWKGAKVFQKTIEIRVGNSLEGKSSCTLFLGRDSVMNMILMCTWV